MNTSEINLPTPMTPRTAVRSRASASTPESSPTDPSNDWENAAWYKEKYPDFTDEPYLIFEMYSYGITAKKTAKRLKKHPRIVK